MSAPAAAIPLPDVRPLIGPVFIGALLHWALLGALCLQVYSYYTFYHKRDNGLIKYTVYIIFFLELLFSMIAVHFSWAFLVEGWGQLASIINLPWSVSVITLGNGLVAGMVQIFFARRIVVLSQSVWAKVVTAVIVVLALFQFAATIAIMIKWSRVDLNAAALLTGTLRDLSLMWLSGSFAADVLIALAMSVILYKSRRRSRIVGTDTLINKLIINTVETGIVTAICAGLDLILVVIPVVNQNYHSTPAFILGKLYSNVLLANLNGRQRYADGGGAAVGTAAATHSDSDAIRMTSTVGHTRSKFNNDDLEGRIHISTNVHRDHYVEYDERKPKPRAL